MLYRVGLVIKFHIEWHLRMDIINIDRFLEKISLIKNAKILEKNKLCEIIRKMIGIVNWDR